MKCQKDAGMPSTISKIQGDVPMVLGLLDHKFKNQKGIQFTIMHDKEMFGILVNECSKQLISSLSMY